MKPKDPVSISQDIHGFLHKIRSIPGTVKRGWLDTATFDVMLDYLANVSGMVSPISTQNTEGKLITTFTWEGCLFERDPLLVVDPDTSMVVFDQVRTDDGFTAHYQHTLVVAY